jgi:hypothetical protein
MLKQRVLEMFATRRVVVSVAVVTIVLQVFLGCQYVRL